MAQIEWYAAEIAGQVAFDEQGGPAHGRDFAAQAREPRPERGGGASHGPGPRRIPLIPNPEERKQ